MLRMHFWTILLTLVSLTAPAAEPVIKRDVIYSRAGGEELKLDVCVPPPELGEGPFPAVVCFHGGGWQAGSRAQYHALLPALAKLGYVGVTVQYRFAPKHRFPAPVEDAKTAVRFLRANAQRWKINGNRIGAAGESAGGLLVLMLALTRPEHGFEGTEHPGHSSALSCAVNFYAVTDFATCKMDPSYETEIVKSFGKSSRQLIEDFLGTSDRSAAAMRIASPLTYVGAGDAPVLTFHGKRDPVVPWSQAQALHDALRKAGVEEKLVLFEQEAHGWGGAAWQGSLVQAAQFLDRHLKQAKPDVK